ncbi:S9 family peptidase [Nakamurella sp. PAMC28650]|uniref:S9 family peptidase n=1 Tax=Nakamurella sp. PAMC28650 TaxID=2762325 RepID=UPI00164DC3F8|nr:S9 family peptidase [Nakamurella sp. PAMC28650]QNK79778.1 S9 family peptidase [Nakamurella sp. PAMC28650]
MKPDDITLLTIPSGPALAPDGTVVVALSHPDTKEDRYAGTLQIFDVNSSVPRDLTLGPRDSAPVISPDGHTVVFLRAGATGPAQLFAIDLRGGEPRALTSHPLGAGVPVFAPDGDRIAYLAAVPEAGRYGTDPDTSADAEPPRRIDRMSYRRDARGFLLDKPEQVFVVGLGPDATAVQLTAEPDVSGGPVFLPDGRICYLRTVTPDRPQTEIAVIGSSPSGDGPGVGDLLASPAGNAGSLVAGGSSLWYLGVEFEGIDSAGRTQGLWSVPIEGGTPRRLTDPEIEVDGSSVPVVLDKAVLVGVLDRGSVVLLAVPPDAERVAAAHLTTVLTGERVVTSFSAAKTPDGTVAVAATVADPGTPGELVTVEISADGRPLGPEQIRSDFAARLRAAGTLRQVEITATAPDGYPVHGFLVLPPGDGPHPVLLVVHGGPHAAYGWGLFDEAQVYAAAGYAVVLPNPRGSAGYGHDHGRTILGRLGSVDADDVLALLDAAVSRPDCDGDRMGVMGGSYGGFMTSWLASHAPDRFTAAISERAVNAWDSFAGSSDIGYNFAEAYTGPDRVSQWEASPLAYADDISLPLLIIHSEHDWRCPIEQGQRLYVALKKRGAEVEMLLFPAEGHELSRSGRPRHRVQRFEAILDWWHRYLPVAAQDGA